MDDDFYSRPLEPGEFRVSHELKTDKVSSFDQRLPHGIYRKGKPTINTFKVRRFTTGLSCELGRVTTECVDARSKPALHLYLQTEKVLSSLGDLTDPKEISSALYSATFMDLIAIFTRFQMQKNRGKIDLASAQCQRCGHIHQNIKGDIATANVRYHEVGESSGPPRGIYRFLEPITIAGQQVSYIVCESPKFSTALNGLSMAQIDNSEETSLRLISASIKFGSGDDFSNLASSKIGPVSVEQIFEMDMEDANNIGDMIDKISGGLERICTFGCANCKDTDGVPTPVSVTINWLNENL